MLRGVLADRVMPQHFALADIAPTARAEELDVFAWGRLTEAVCSAPSKAQAPGANA
jgi:hypothetical protein